MSARTINESELPVRDLKVLGLSRQMIEDLPERIQDDLYNGRLSPPMMVNIDLDGESRSILASFSFQRQQDGSVKAVTHLRLAEPSSNGYSPDQLKVLNDGGVILSTMHNPDGDPEDVYIQLDKRMNLYRAIPKESLDDTLQVYRKAFYLNDAQVRKILSGKPHEIIQENERATIGVDLTSRTGIAQVYGGAEDWYNRKYEDFKYEFGVNGCWVVSDDGSFNYVDEEDYDDVMREELRKKTDQNRGRQNIVQGSAR